MKNFLVKLYEDGKLQPIDASEEISLSYMIKSSKSLLSSKTLKDIGNHEDCVALAYYSMYHSLLALLFKVGIKSENHKASITLLKEIFDIDNSSILFAKSERVDKQYYVEFNASEKDSVIAIKNAEEFIDTVNDFIGRLNNENIKKYKEIFQKIIY